jgi:hypothetical protein
MEFGTPCTRRRWLQQAGAGFGMLGLAGSLQAAGLLDAESTPALPHF